MKTSTSLSRWLSFRVAACDSFYTPLVVLLTFLIFEGLNSAEPLSDDIFLVLIGICISSLISGIASLFGIPKHGVGRILSAAFFGILLSLGVAYVAAVFKFIPNA
ncbi:MAG TPA: hypothetical protein VGO57_04455 [Verrucomicrobiae bacterium]|jgi:hypothetical protein